MASSVREPRLVVNELYLSLQGESSFTGRPCFFIRLTGCPLRCVWCDTAHAFHDGERMTVQSILDRVEKAACRLVEVTGGEPLAQPGVYDLLDSLLDEGYIVLLETAGAHDISRVDPRVHRIVDVKCPGSGEVERNHPAVRGHLTSRDEIKFVIADRNDYQWAKTWLNASTLPSGLGVLFSPVHERLPPRDLVVWVLEDGVDVRVQVQLHKYIWDPLARGV